MKLFNFDTDERWEYENGFYLTSHVTRLAKVLAHYELYKSIINLPGDIVECGVYKGASILRLATFRELSESPHSRKIIGFDAFGKFPDLDNIADQKVKAFEKQGGDGISVDELRSVFEFKSFNNYELIQGDICKTIPAYILQHPELKIVFLHIDVDAYKPTLVILNNLYERVVKNGIVAFDDFSTISDETKAVDEFFEGKDILIEKLPISRRPAYIRKK